MKTKDKFETIEVERPEAAIARIVMNRPEARNAQNLQMTYDLNAAFDAAVQDDAVKVIILAGSVRISPPATICVPAAGTRRASTSRRSAIGVVLPSPTPMAASRASRKSICRSRGAGATSPSRPSRKCTANASPAG